MPITGSPSALRMIATIAGKVASLRSSVPVVEVRNELEVGKVTRRAGTEPAPPPPTGRAR